MSDERKRAILLANKILDRPSGDPDDDLAVLSRQLLRAVERGETNCDEYEAACRKRAANGDAHIAWLLQERSLMFLMGVEIGFREHERGSNLEAALGKAENLLATETETTGERRRTRMGGMASVLEAHDG